MFKDIIPDKELEPSFITTRIVIKKGGLIIASFRGNYMIGQIESEYCKSIKTRYDHTSNMKIVEIEV